MELNFKEFGHGEPVIILHGLFGTLDNWQTIAKQLAEEYWVFIIDQRNHGRSPHVADISYPLMAEDLKLFMEQHWIPKAHIIGHSMGGKTSMQFALDHPDMVDKLVVVDIAPGKNEARHLEVFNALLSINFDQVSNRKEVDELLAKKIPDFGVRQFLLKNMIRDKEVGYRWKMNLSAITQNYEKILAAVQNDITYDEPSLFIRGEESPYISKEREQEIFGLFPEAKLVTVEKAGHWVHADQPRVLLEEVFTFFKS